jgi:hypothetical protein
MAVRITQIRRHCALIAAMTDRISSTLPVLRHRQKFGLPTWVAEKGVRYRKPERPKGCFAFSVPDPFFPCRWKL